MSAPRVRIWDLPTRLFHWAIVLLIPALWWTEHKDKLELHIQLGEGLLGLVLFRLLWGVMGSSTARFASFVRGPAAVWRYVRGQAGKAIGHNPVGGWSVLVMLLLLVIEVGLGLFVGDEDGIYGGPLSDLVDYDFGRSLAEWHETIFYVLLGFIALHIAAILYYLLVQRDNLVTPMVSGRKPVEAPGEAMIPAPAWRFLIAAVLSAGLTLVVVYRFV